MPQIINTNIASLTAQRNLNTSQSANSTALERLSSGLRINSAKDDAAGLAISTKFESQIKGLNVAIRNAGDGVSLAQTAEGALGAMTDNLQRVRELAVQSSNATNSDDDRVALQKEVTQLMSEIGRIAEETNFNGKKLLDGSFNGTFQVGANAGNTIDVNISELTVEKLGSSSQAGVSAVGTDQALANGDLEINGQGIRASLAGDDLLSTENREKSGIAKAAAVNASSAETGVTATVDANTVIGSEMDAAGSAVVPEEITLNGIAITVDGTANANDADKASTRGSVIESINSKAGQTGVIASDGGNDGGVILTAEDGRNITMTQTNAGVDLGIFGLADADPAGASAINSYAGFTLTSANASTNINVSGGNGTGNGDLANAGLTAGTYSAQTAVTTSTVQTVGAAGTDTQVAVTAAATAAALTDVVSQYGITVGTAASDSTADMDAALSDAGFSEFSVGTATGTEIRVAVAGAAASEKRLSDGDLVINDIAIQASTTLDDTASNTTAATSDAAASGISIAAAINKSSEQTSVTATANATEVVGGDKDTLLPGGTLKSGANGGAVAVGASINLTVNGVDVVLTETNDYEKNKAAAIIAINEVYGQTGVLAEDNGESLTLTAADGRNVSLFADSTQVAENVTDLDTDIQNFGLSLDDVGVDTGDSGVDTFTYAGGAKTTYSTVSLQSAVAFEVGYGTNGSKALDDSGFTAGKFGGGEDGQSLKDLDVSTFEGAQAAITAIDNALDTVSGQRADLGAIQNRFDSTVSNLSITSENLTAANSRIRDADFAAESAELSRTQVLQQAGVSILAQANQRGQSVLSLLG